MPEPEPEPEQLTISDAGARYLEAVCPVNAVWDAVDIEVDHLRVAAARGDAADTAAFAGVMHELQSASAAAEQTLGDEAVEWPAVAKGAVERVRASLEADAGQAERVARLAASDAASHTWEGAAAAASAAQEARAALGLPENARVACEEWSKTG